MAEQWCISIEKSVLELKTNMSDRLFLNPSTISWHASVSYIKGRQTKPHPHLLWPTESLKII